MSVIAIFRCCTCAALNFYFKFKGNDNLAILDYKLCKNDFCKSILLVTVADAAIFCDSAAFLCVLSHNTNSVLISCQSYITRRGTTTASFLFVHNNVNFSVYVCMITTRYHIVSKCMTWSLLSLQNLANSSWQFAKQCFVFVYFFEKCLMSFYPNLDIILVWYCIRKYSSSAEEFNVKN